MAQGQLAAATSGVARLQPRLSAAGAPKLAPGFYSTPRPPPASSSCPLSTRSAGRLRAPVPSLRGSDKLALPAHEGTLSRSRLTNALPVSSPSLESLKAELRATRPAKEAAELLQILARAEKAVAEDLAARRQWVIDAENRSKLPAVQPAQRALRAPACSSPPSKAQRSPASTRTTVRQSPPGSRPVNSASPRGSPGNLSGASPAALARKNAPASSLAPRGTNKLVQLPEVQPAQRPLRAPACCSPPSKAQRSPAGTCTSRSTVRPSPPPGSRPVNSASSRRSPGNCSGASPTTFARKNAPASSLPPQGTNKLVQAGRPARSTPTASLSAVGTGTPAARAVTGPSRPTAKPRRGQQGQRAGQSPGAAAARTKSGKVQAGRAAGVEQQQPNPVVPSVSAPEQEAVGDVAAGAAAARLRQKAAELQAELGHWEGSWLSGASPESLESGRRLDEAWLGDLVVGMEGAEGAVPRAPAAAAAFWRGRVAELERKLQPHREEGLVEGLSCAHALGDPAALWRGVEAGAPSAQGGSDTKDVIAEHSRVARSVSRRCGA